MIYKIQDSFICPCIKHESVGNPDSEVANKSGCRSWLCHVVYWYLFFFLQIFLNKSVITISPYKLLLVRFIASSFPKFVSKIIYINFYQLIS